MKKNKVNKEIKWKRSDILSVLAMIISIISIVICLIQTGIQRHQLESQLKENQPIFKLFYDSRKSERDSTLDTKALTIKNVGKEARSIDIGLRTFVELRVTKNEEEESFYIPVLDLFITSDLQNVRHLEDGFVHTYEKIDDTLGYDKFHQECQEKSDSLINYDSDLIEFAIISYTDIYGENHVEYFKGETICPEEYYDYVVKKSRDVFSGVLYCVAAGLKFDEIIERIKLKLKK